MESEKDLNITWRIETKIVPEKLYGKIFRENEKKQKTKQNPYLNYLHSKQYRVQNTHTYQARKTLITICIFSYFNLIKTKNLRGLHGLWMLDPTL